MQNDPDLQGVSPQAATPVPATENEKPGNIVAFASGVSSPKLSIVAIVMAVFAVLNLIYLAISASYAVGLLENLEVTTGATTFVINLLMTFITGGLGLFFAFIGYKVAKMSGLKAFEITHKVLFVAIALLAVVSLVGPVLS